MPLDYLASSSPSYRCVESLCKLQLNTCNESYIYRDHTDVLLSNRVKLEKQNNLAPFHPPSTKTCFCCFQEVPGAVAQIWFLVGWGGVGWGGDGKTCFLLFELDSV